MSSTDQNVLWLYHQRENVGIRWVELSDRYGEEFRAEWLEEALQNLEARDISARYVLAPNSAMFSLSHSLGVPLGKWLGEIGFQFVAEERLELMPDVVRVVILDEPCDMGAMIMWFRKPRVIVESSASAFEMISDGTDLL